jgi:hypothetical protein
MVDRVSPKHPFEDALWRSFDEMLPPELQGDRNAYVLQYLSTPLLVRAGATAYWDVWNLCDRVPEWGPNYDPSLLHVAAGYRAFLNSLEPIVPTLARPADRRKLELAQQTIRAARSGARQERRVKDSPELTDAQNTLEAVLQKYRAAAAKKGLRSIGGADYFSADWNDAYEEEQPGAVVTRVKRCEAEGLAGWLDSGDGRLFTATGNSALKQHRQATGVSTQHEESSQWQYVDIGDSRVRNLETSTLGVGGSLQVTLQARRLKVFWFKRPGWFSPEAVQLYGSKGPWAVDRPAKDPLRDLWGEKGVLRLLPVAVLVVDSPGAAVRVNQGDYERLERWANDPQANAPLQIGLVQFQRQGQRFSITFNDSAREVTILPNAQAAYVVAVLSLRMPYSVNAEWLN